MSTRTLLQRTAPLASRVLARPSALSPMIATPARISRMHGLPSFSAHPFRPASVRFLSDNNKEEDKKEEPETPAAEEEEEANKSEETAPEPSREEQLEAQVKELKDQLLRSLAEQENTRRIAQRDMEAAKQFSIKSFAKSLLDVSDNLTRALAAVPVEERANKDGNPVLANLYEGIEMTERGLTKAFEINGLQKYGKEGELFDPNLHEALYEYVDPSKKPGTVGQVMKMGFKLNNRVLRPAEVGVVKKE